jgi:uncharacterized protein (DUF3820 family)
MRMPFGKYKGQNLAALPDEYLLWVLANVALRDPLGSAITDEMARRGYEELPPRQFHPPDLATSPVRPLRAARGLWAAIRKRSSGGISRCRPASAARPKGLSPGPYK